MSKIKNSGLDQYATEPFAQQQFGTAGAEGVKQQCDKPVSNSTALKALDETVDVVFVQRHLKARLLVTMYVLMSGAGKEFRAAVVVNGQPLRDFCTSNNQLETKSRKTLTTKTKQRIVFGPGRPNVCVYVCVSVLIVEISDFKFLTDLDILTFRAISVFVKKIYHRQFRHK